MTRYGGMVGMIYMIVTTEQIVSRNLKQITDPDARGELNDWSYSQTIALIMLGQQIMDSWEYFKDEYEYRKRQRAAEHGDPMPA